MPGGVPSCMTADVSASSPPRPVVVFDVLGTLVDQTESLRRHVAAVTGIADAAGLVDEWLHGVAQHEQAVVRGERAFAPSEQLDAEVLRGMAGTHGLSSAEVSALAGASAHSIPWPDASAALDALSSIATVVGLSNASRRVLTGLSATAGFRWHQLLSAEDAGTYKPDAAIYELAMATARVGEHPPYMVAAHAWDLRAARAAGMRTAYVPRPNAEPPAPGERFDLHATSLADLEAQLRAAPSGQSRRR